jgi:hypothetical protein
MLLWQLNLKKWWQKLIEIDLWDSLLCEFESCSGGVYSIQHYVIMFVSDLQQGMFFSGFLHHCL